MTAIERKMAAAAALVLVLSLSQLAVAAFAAGPEGEGPPRAAGAPPWAVGSAWTWTIDQEILFSDVFGGFDVVVNHVSGSMTDTVAELTFYNGTRSYLVGGTYSLTLKGNYSAGIVKYPFSWPVSGNGTTYCRVPDLALVREELHLIANMGVLGSLIYCSTADASPPAENFRFPLDVGASWSVHTVYTTWEKVTDEAGTTESNNVTVLDYDAGVPATEEVVVPAGTLSCYNITYAGTSTSGGGTPEPYNDSALYSDAATNLARREFTPLANLTVEFGLASYSLNHAPSVVSPPPAVVFEEGTAGSLDLLTVFSDPDPGDTMTFSASNYTRLSVTFSSSVADFTAEAGWTGTETVLFEATDLKGARAEASIAVTVTPVSGNRNPPVATSSRHSYSIIQGSSLTLDLSQRFSDPDSGDTLTFSVEGLPGNFTVSLDSRTGSLSVTPPAAFVGAVTFTARATDSTNLSANETIALTVEAANRAPVLRGFSPPLASPTVLENSSQDFSVDAFDPEGKALTVTWSLDGVNSGAGPNFTFRPAFGTAGRHNLTASVSDGAIVVAQSWDVTVTHVNRPPEAVGITSPRDGASVKRGARVNFIGTGLDPDNDPLTFTWKDTDGKVLGTGRDLTLSNLTKGRHLITLEVSDGAASVTAQVLVTVSAPSSGGGGTPGFSAAALLASAAAALLLARRRTRQGARPLHA